MFGFYVFQCDDSVFLVDKFKTDWFARVFYAYCVEPTFANEFVVVLPCVFDGQGIAAGRMTKVQHQRLDNPSLGFGVHAQQV